MQFVNTVLESWRNWLDPAIELSANDGLVMFGTIMIGMMVVAVTGVAALRKWGGE